MGSKKIQIFEVGARDGLQNEPQAVSLETKIGLIQSLVKCGVREIELGAFVRPDKVPRMADTDQIYQAIAQGQLKLGKARGWALVPNRKGLERALLSGADSIAVFTAASETFNQKNIGMSIEQSFSVIEEVVKEAKRKKLKVRGYVSTAFGCPFEGEGSPKKTLKVIQRLLKLGVYQVSIGDTIGVATPADVDRVIRPALKKHGKQKIAVHFHDTRGTALANAYRAWELGVQSFDSSAGGLGGCPFAPGATGNLATEDLVYLFDGLGVKSGVDLSRLAQTSLELAQKMQRPLSSRYLQAFAAQCETVGG